MKKLLLIVFLFTSFSVFLLLPKDVAALSGSDFQAGRIIDDGIFFSGNTISANDIQIFLNSKVPVCDTNGTLPRGGTTRAAYGTSRGYPPPYTCLRDFTQDTPSKSTEAGLCNQYNGGVKSAAQIIFDVGIACNINPKALIVLLEKEQSLVVDDWPWSIQYRSATGYGCPDTAPCDAEYYGFFNQVYNAARQFKRYQRDANVFNYRFARSNYIQYNPNASCGGTNVYIQNQATAGLYNYTPYQPNASSLANLYGSGDGCGAYGNRNFWRLFNDWFGSTISGLKPSIVYKGINGTQLFAVWENKKYYIPSYDVMIAWGLHTQPVTIINDQYLDSMETGDTLSNIAKMSDDPASPLFLFDDGRRYPIQIEACAKDLSGQPNPSTTWGLDCFNAAVSKSYPKNFVENASSYDGALPPMIAFQGSIWKMEGGKKRRIIDPLIVDVLGGYKNVRTMKDLNAMQSQGKIVMRNDYVLRFAGSDQVYLFDNEELIRIPGLDEYFAWGLDRLPLVTLPAEWNSPDPLPVEASSLTITSKNGTQRYVVDKGYKLPIDSQWPNTSTDTIAPFALNRLQEIPMSNVQKSDNGLIFTVYSNKLYVFPTMEDFKNLGFNENTIRRVSTSVEHLQGLGYGGMHLANGRLYKINNNPNQIYRVNGVTSQYVNSINYPGLPYDRLITVDPQTALRYPVSGTYSP